MTLPLSECFLSFFFFHRKFIGVMYTHLQAHTHIMVADKTERVQMETFFSTKYAV